MSHNEYRHIGGKLRFYERDDVGYDEGCWTCETFLCGGVHRTAPAPLIECYGLDASGGKRREEFIVPVYVVIEAMDEDQFCDWRSIGLWIVC